MYQLNFSLRKIVFPVFLQSVVDDSQWKTTSLNGFCTKFTKRLAKIIEHLYGSVRIKTFMGIVFLLRFTCLQKTTGLPCCILQMAEELSLWSCGRSYWISANPDNMNLWWIASKLFVFLACHKLPACFVLTPFRLKQDCTSNDINLWRNEILAILSYDQSIRNDIK